MKDIKIGERLIGRGRPAFIVAEAGINHQGKLEAAKKLIIAAARCGADAVKFQTYRAEKRVAPDSPIFALLKECELGEESHRQLIKVAKEHNIIFFSTPFDEGSVDLLFSLGVPALKIASFDIVNLRLLAYAAGKGLPLIVSTGMADKIEIDKAIGVMDRFNLKYCLLHCISTYPTRDEEANLNVIKSLLDSYDCPVGYSDHTLGVEAPVMAVLCGASIIEKHFTLDKNLAGPDHKLSADPSELRRMAEEIRRVEKILGSSEIKAFESEKPTLVYRRPSTARQ